MKLPNFLFSLRTNYIYSYKRKQSFQSVNSMSEFLRDKIWQEIDRSLKRFQDININKIDINSKNN